MRRAGVAKGQCIRVSPAIYTSETDLDRLVQALGERGIMAWGQGVTLAGVLLMLGVVFAGRLAAKAVDLIFEEPIGLPRLYTDDKKLAQILRNFIANALKFTTRGEVRVSARLQGTDNVRFAVSDTGTGIQPERFCQRMFTVLLQRTGDAEQLSFSLSGKDLTRADLRHSLR